MKLTRITLESIFFVPKLSQNLKFASAPKNPERNLAVQAAM